MKVGTDGMLLGAWTPIAGGERVLDIGTGTGLVALMLAQRGSKLQIEAIELDPEAASQAEENVASSPFVDRIRVRTGDLKSFQPNEPYDLIVSNPPFFAAGSPSPDPRKQQARHEASLPLSFLLAFAGEHLLEGGTLALIIPIDRLAGTIQIGAIHQLWPQQICRVMSTPQKSPHRALVYFAKGKAGKPTESVLVLQENGEFSQTYKDLTKDFHPFL